MLNCSDYEDDTRRVEAEKRERNKEKEGKRAVEKRVTKEWERNREREKDK